jgi:very-short-patch-repair endonuclease
VLAAGEPALLAGVSALAAQGLDGFRTTAIHVLLPVARRELDPPRGVVVHRTSALPEEDINSRRRPPCTRVPRSIVDAASWARSDREATLIVVMAFQQRLVRVEQVEDVLARMPRAKRRRLVAAVARDAADGAHSLGELDVVRLLRKEGLPTPTGQAVRRDSSGRRRYLDLYFEEWDLHVEIDGRHHDNPGQAWLDMDRQNALWTPGKRDMRFPSWLVRVEPGVFLARVRAALRERGWPG